jgi:hypothetical protein
MAIYLRDLHKADTHPKGSIVLIDCITIRPDHLAVDLYALMIRGIDGNSQDLIELQRLLTVDKHTVNGNVDSLPLYDFLTQYYCDGPSNANPIAFSSFDCVFQMFSFIRQSFSFPPCVATFAGSNLDSIKKGILYV